MIGGGGAAVSDGARDGETTDAFASARGAHQVWRCLGERFERADARGARRARHRVRTRGPRADGQCNKRESTAESQAAASTVMTKCSAYQ